MDTEYLASAFPRRKTLQVKVRNLHVGSKHPVVVQSMTNTDTGDVSKTVAQIIELYKAGSEMVRFTVQNVRMAKAVKGIREALDDLGYDVPLIGDFHFNGHQLLREVPECAEALDKYRINPGNVGFGERHDDNFKAFIDLAKEYDKPVRIGVNWGSLDQTILTKLMEDNKKRKVPKPTHIVTDEAVVESAVQSVKKAVEYGLEPNRIIVRTKISEVPDMVTAYEILADSLEQPLHVGLTEAGIGSKGIVASSAALAMLLSKGIGDTIRVSLTPTPNTSRAEEVIVSRQILQSLGIRHFTPLVSSCPGCGRTTSIVFQEMAEELTNYLQERTPEWKEKGYKGVEEMKVAVMGCVVNGPGESKHANLGISLPGTGEDPFCIIYEDGKQVASVRASVAPAEFKKRLEAYVESHYGKVKEVTAPN
ncbi:TPA: flavodoxin-dependent (E)-4-hydroxy-3-methylbut-2-enyl-diphosphate synthase [Candidatus Micrarchaeota archaeon]|nr:flavodoxin-dependent (E)-4-hydroxy-3-methylbut-2-enyl-diphosphate synthase [Candidatus Micrarchaeota archaeon]HII09638.1 flavodoxin-dependent (E)-4-hydroxy-3-methylbut-2-enyl-diphosphate synthase [Candidatus Micrarchaeota archaeon]